MLIALHKNARTTPAVRAEIAASDEPASILAQRFGITEQTVYKWKKRDVFADRSHTAHRLQTVLTPAQETVVVHLRRTLLLPLDDLLAVTREFICPHVSRSGLDRCLRRHGAGNLNALKPQEPAVAHKAFKSYEPGYVHMDVKYLPQMQDESSRRYLFVAIDRATRWVFVQLKSNKTAASAQAFLKALHKACPIRINKLLTDNGKEFTDRLFASKEREPSGNHEFDQLCRELGIEHRLTKPRTPRTNGMVERFNGRIADVLKTHRFNSREDMEETLLRYVALYNHQLPQSALKSSTPMQAMKDWYQTHPHLFHKRPYDRTGCDSYQQPVRIAALQRSTTWQTWQEGRPAPTMATRPARPFSSWPPAPSVSRATLPPPCATLPSSPGSRPPASTTTSPPRRNWWTRSWSRAATASSASSRSALPRWAPTPRPSSAFAQPCWVRWRGW